MLVVEDLDIESGILIRDEIRMVIRYLKSGKVVGFDGIFCEVFKVDIEIIVDMLYFFF